MTNIFYFTRNLSDYPVEQCKIDILDALESFNNVDVMKSEKLNNEWSKNIEGNSILYFSFFPESQKDSILFSVSVSEINSSTSSYTFITIRADKHNNSWYSDVDGDKLTVIKEEVVKFSELFFEDIQELFFNINNVRKHYREIELMDDYQNSNPTASIVLIVVTVVIIMLVIGFGIGSLI